jgi:hypothetical protein
MTEPLRADPAEMLGRDLNTGIGVLYALLGTPGCRCSCCPSSWPFGCWCSG